MANFNKLIKERMRILDTAPEGFQDAVVKAQISIWKEIQDDFADLQTKDGKIIQSERNLIIAEKIVAKLRTVTSTGDYIKAVSEFLQQYDQLAQINNDLARAINKGFKPNEFSAQIRQTFKEVGVQQLFTAPSLNSEIALRSNIIASITSGSSYRDLVESAREIVEGSPYTDGRMLANVKTVAATSMSVADAAYSSHAAQLSGAEWYRYGGGTIKTSREFCIERDGKYFHKKEIQAWGRGDNAGGVGGINKEGEWDGQIEGTDASTIFLFRGGWNCRHYLIFVPISNVPQDVIQRNIANGNYKPQ